MSSLGSAELTLWHQSSGSVANADLLPRGKVRKETGAQRALSWFIMEVWENGTILWVPLVFICDMKRLLFLFSVSPGQSSNHWGDSLAGHSFPTGDASQIFKEYLLLPGTWLGQAWPWNCMESRLLLLSQARARIHQGMAGSQSPPDDKERVRGGP